MASPKDTRAIDDDFEKEDFLVPLKASLKILRDAPVLGLLGATNRLLGSINKNTVQGSRDSEEWDTLRGYAEQLWFLVTEAQGIGDGAALCTPLVGKIDGLSSKIKKASVDKSSILDFLSDDPWNALDEFQVKLQGKVCDEMRQPLDQLLKEFASELERVKNPTSGDYGLSIRLTGITARTAKDIGSGNVVGGQRKVDLRIDNAQFGDVGNLLSGNTQKEGEDKSDGGGESKKAISTVDQGVSEGNTKTFKGRPFWGL
ncbi:hypothetical protein BYT27DRAFT_7184650 [Phlegmacium glaucopus]|nr:hypothetical protein BYT27DRAFT_7184650 [Phlegmacium glaucopus]